MDLCFFLFKICEKKCHDTLNYYTTNITKVNGWILYRKHCEQNRVPVKSRMTLLKFTTDIAPGLMHAEQLDPKTLGGWSAKRPVPNDAEKKAKKARSVALLPALY